MLGGGACSRPPFLDRKPQSHVGCRRDLAMQESEQARAGHHQVRSREAGRRPQVTWASAQARVGWALWVQAWALLPAGGTWSWNAPSVRPRGHGMSVLGPDTLELTSVGGGPCGHPGGPKGVAGPARSSGEAVLSFSEARGWMDGPASWEAWR